MKGFSEIYFPGEQSSKERQRDFEAGEFELSDTIFEQINNLLKE